MFTEIEQAIRQIKTGKMVILIDDAQRENEGDLVLAAEKVSPEAINFMAKYGRGLICVAITAERASALGLELMTRSNTAPYQTNFTVSIDAIAGTTTGISAFDRARTIEAMLDPQATPHDFARPGHIFPLIAQGGGILKRAGHTEAGVDLARLADLYPAAIICEILNEDGTMARLPELANFAQQHNLSLVTIADLIEYRKRHEKLVERASSAELPTKYGKFYIRTYTNVIDDFEHVALIKGDIEGKENVLVRVHSECLTGDALGSQRCDCGEQLACALRMIEEEKEGVLLYMRQEGRGIGLKEKVSAYHLQDHGLDTVEANERLGFKADLRDYGIGAQILCDLGLRSIRLLTNNPKKVVGLSGYGLKITAQIPLEVEPTEYNRHYLQTKREKLGHKLQKI
ncbi:bifunctional 3,4-dihydroxy-2-butanone-4-phosphate synthase/GTP cyclohydrolase II [Candidatus Bipolaricaulota bacterium]|nr:bifunctional 3,4-dihydroxy-2-butanone-4-phosphate synthase/GTP cyclohydrolase II [Candidatus Bipolaricaulota bacterium]HBR10581.1 bifunctional 3,4-dihydroxy-2-butanone-4-phosphate synthase/GTP cyclohydrolase II [Candidatus Acetothermia bacterium]